MEKLKNQLRVSVSNSGFVDNEDGSVSFPNGLTITDESEMRSGSRYDIKSLDIDNYEGQLTADHRDSLGTLIGKVNGVRKMGDRVTIQGIKYAVTQNPYARLAYDLLVGGFSNSFSIETIGPWPDPQDPVYRDHELIGLSQVVVPNNYNAKINQFNEIVHNSLERSQQDGLDVSGIEEKFLAQVKLVKSEAVEEESMSKKEEVTAPVKEETPVETPVETPEVQETEVVETEVEETEVKNDATEETPEAPAEEEKTEVENEAPVATAEEETPEDEAADTDETTEVENEAKTEPEEAPAETEEVETNKNNKENIEMTKEELAQAMQEAVASAVAAALKPVQEELAATKEVAQNALDAQAKEPEFEKVEEVKNSYDDLTEEELFSKQLQAAVLAERTQNVEARKVVNEINARNLAALKEAKIVNNAMTVEDLGNFIIGPELYNQVVGVRTNYQALIDATQWRETNALEFSWLSRTSDIDMQPVAIGALGDVPSPDTTDNRLKPVSVPTYGPNTDKLEELAAVTPISINVIKFAAADILADLAEGYRNDYDKKRAQLVIARLQQAVNANGKKYAYDISDGIIQFAKVVATLSDVTTVGTLVLNSKSLAMIKGAAIDANLESILLELAQGTVLGTPFLVVPNDLLPTLNSTETKVFKVQNVNVTIDQAVFYADLRTFTGRSSGGLKYDVDGSASYEIDGTVYSAYQRNEVVIRGSFFRGGVVKDPSVVASIAAIAVS